MKISWYPGHMHKARKELAATLRDTDVVLELLDARAPAASTNPLLARLRGDRPCIKILTKTDLADPEITRVWQQHYDAGSGISCLLSGLDNPLSRTTVITACRRLMGRTQDSEQTFQVLITGIPNVGKSTLLNSLLGRKVARTGNEPAITRAQQRVRLDLDCYLVDSPGMLWPRLDDQVAAYRLACLGSIRNTALDLQEVAWFAAETLLESFFPQLQARYHFSQKPAGAEALLRDLAIRQGCLKSGGAVDWQRVSTLLLDDLRSGRLGRISLERPTESEPDESHLRNPEAVT